MIDAEVLRLRKLRNVSLRARALAKVLDSDSAADKSAFARCAVLCWTLARLATGRLRAHPYPNYQKDPSQLRDIADRLIASCVALDAVRRKRRLSVYGKQLQAVAREVNDVRSLTWSADLSDALGRMQIQMRRLVNEIEAGAFDETGATAMPRNKLVACADTRTALEDISVENNWPYLAI